MKRIDLGRSRKAINRKKAIGICQLRARRRYTGKSLGEIEVGVALVDLTVSTARLPGYVRVIRSKYVDCPPPVGGKSAVMNKSTGVSGIRCDCVPDASAFWISVRL